MQVQALAQLWCRWQTQLGSETPYATGRPKKGEKGIFKIRRGQGTETALTGMVVGWGLAKGKNSTTLGHFLNIPNPVSSPIRAARETVIKNQLADVLKSLERGVPIVAPWVKNRTEGL